MVCIEVILLILMDVLVSLFTVLSQGAAHDSGEEIKRISVLSRVV